MTTIRTAQLKRGTHGKKDPNDYRDEPEKVRRVLSGVETIPEVEPRYFTDPTPISYEKVFATEPSPPPVLVPGIIPREAFTLLGPGGVAKTTLALWIMVHVILGRKVFGREVQGPGACLFVSAEDPAETVYYRVRQICDALDLTPDEQHLVAEKLHMEDITGKLMRYVEADKQGNLQITEAVSHLIEAYQNASIQLVVMDPATFFGPGERFVNDAESALMQAARRISKGLDGAAVGYLHHVGKAAAREEMVDQYSGRGGSAMADNARAVLVLRAHNYDLKESPKPSSVPTEDVDDGRVLRLHIAKFSAGKREQDPIWIVRGQTNPWEFTIHETEHLTEDEIKERSKKKQDLFDYAALKDIRRFLKENTSKFPTKTTVRNTCDVHVNGNKVGKTRIVEIIDRAIQRGEIIEEGVPEGYRRGAKKIYLKAVWPTTDITPGRIEGE